MGESPNASVVGAGPTNYFGANCGSNKVNFKLDVSSNQASSIENSSRPAPESESDFVPRLHEICRQIFGGVPASFKRSGDGNNFVFRFELQGCQYFLKFASKDKKALLEYEANAIKQLHQWGLPAPEIYTREDLREQLDGDQHEGWMLLRDGGGGLTRCLSETPRLMIEAGILVRRYHTQEFDGFGKIVDGQVVPDDMLAERLLPLCNNLMRHSRQGLIRPNVAKAAFQHMETYTPVGQPVLCHGELTLPHLLVKDGKVSMGIDWAYMASQPAAYDLASMEVYCEISDFDFDNFLKGYDLALADYLSDPIRNNCRLIHVIRQLATVNSKTFTKLRKILESTISELGEAI